MSKFIWSLLLLCFVSICGESFAIAQEVVPQVSVFPNAESVCIKASNVFCTEIEKSQKNNSKLVFILPTGATPEKFYDNLVQKWEIGKIDLSKIVTFNMDEYVGLGINHPQSYRYYMFSKFHGLVCNHLTEWKLKRFGLTMRNKSKEKMPASFRLFLSRVRQEIITKINTLSPGQVTPKIAERVLISAMTRASGGLSSANGGQSEMEFLMGSNQFPSISNMAYAIAKDNHLWRKGISLKNVHIPNGLAGHYTKEGMSEELALSTEANNYRKVLMKYRKSENTRIVLFGGIGKNPAHIAFNDLSNEEAFFQGSDEELTKKAKETITRIVPLSEGTMRANSRFFKDQLDKVPKKAITIGFDEMIHDSRGVDRVVILATGDSKAWALYKTFHDEKPSHKIPASLLRNFTRGPLEFLIDTKAYEGEPQGKSLSIEVGRGAVNSNRVCINDEESLAESILNRV